MEILKNIHFSNNNQTLPPKHLPEYIDEHMCINIKGKVL